MEWRGENLSRLRELAGSPEILSASEMAAHFGCSRNAIIGACLRNNIKLPHPSSRAGCPDRKPRPERRRPFQPFSGGVISQSPLRCAPVEPLHLSLFDLGRDSCRFPYGGDDGEPVTFCGHARHGESSYCAEHTRLSWVKPRQITDAEREKRRRRMHHVRIGLAVNAA